MKSLLKSSELGDKVNLSRQHIHRMAKAGEIPGTVKQGKQFRFNTSIPELPAWIRARRKNPAQWRKEVLLPPDTSEMVTLKEEINSLARETESQARKAKEGFRRAFLTLRECGQLLKTARDYQPGGKFEVWFAKTLADHGGMSCEQAKVCMKMADIPESDIDAVYASKLGFQILGIFPIKPRPRKSK